MPWAELRKILFSCLVMLYCTDLANGAPLSMGNTSCPCGPSHYILTEGEGSKQFLAFPPTGQVGYPAGCRCEWDIQSNDFDYIRIKTISFNTNAGEDFLSFFIDNSQNPRQICTGDICPSWFNAGDSVRLTFTSDMGMADQWAGFRLAISQHLLPPEVPSPGPWTPDDEGSSDGDEIASKLGIVIGVIVALCVCATCCLKGGRARRRPISSPVASRAHVRATPSSARIVPVAQQVPGPAFSLDADPPPYDEAIKITEPPPAYDTVDGSSAQSE